VPVGIVPEEKAFISSYQYNDIASLEAAVAAAGDDLAGIFATPFKHDSFEDQALPDPAYARRARELCDATGAMLIVDDVRAGFRLTRDCSWELLGVRPDLSAWGKSFANGYPISALLGSDRCRKAASNIYVTGSFWFAAVPMAAGVETLKILRDSDYLEHTIAMGERLRAGFGEAAARHGFSLRQTGPAQMPLVLFDDDADFRVGFAFAEEMLERGVFFHPWHNMFMCQAMTVSEFDMSVDAADGSFAAVRDRFDTLTAHPIVAMLVAAN
jgi:glutamate-1-semialdehyde 2,1-aminomutase